MATSPRKTIKSNPLDKIVTSRSKSTEPVAAKKTVARRVAASKAPKSPEAVPAKQSAPVAQTVQSVLTAEEVLEKEFLPSSGIVMIPSNLFDPEDRLADVHALHTVKTWSQWAVLAGLIPTPVIDTVAISAVQIKMIHALCKLYSVQFKKEAALAVVSGLVGGSLTTTLAGMGGVILSNLPAIGSIMKYTAQPALSYASTYALGRVFMRHFQDNGTMADLDSKKLETYFKEQYAKGRKMFKYEFKRRQRQTV